MNPEYGRIIAAQDDDTTTTFTDSSVPTLAGPRCLRASRVGSALVAGYRCATTHVLWVTISSLRSRPATMTRATVRP